MSNKREDNLDYKLDRHTKKREKKNKPYNHCWTNGTSESKSRNVEK